jgi:hypothetical protein
MYRPYVQMNEKTKNIYVILSFLFVNFQKFDTVENKLRDVSLSHSDSYLITHAVASLSYVDYQFFS